jgi:hypothetical protein
VNADVIAESRKKIRNKVIKGIGNSDEAEESNS